LSIILIYYAKSRLEVNRPYEHEILVDIVKEVLLTRRKSFLLDNVEVFEVVWQGEKLVELPQATIALAATAVCFSKYYYCCYS
jgi:hypothetical protein